MTKHRSTKACTFNHVIGCFLYYTRLYICSGTTHTVLLGLVRHCLFLVSNPMFSLNTGLPRVTPPSPPANEMATFGATDTVQDLKVIFSGASRYFFRRSDVCIFQILPPPLILACQR